LGKNCFQNKYFVSLNRLIDVVKTNMMMNENKDIDININLDDIPQSWNDLSEKQLAGAIQLLSTPIPYKEENPFVAQQIMLLQIIFSESSLNGHFEKLDTDQINELLPLTDFFFVFTKDEEGDTKVNVAYQLTTNKTKIKGFEPIQVNHWSLYSGCQAWQAFLNGDVNNDLFMSMLYEKKKKSLYRKKKMIYSPIQLALCRFYFMSIIDDLSQKYKHLFQRKGNQPAVHSYGTGIELQHEYLKLTGKQLEKQDEVSFINAIRHIDMDRREKQQINDNIEKQNAKLNA